MKKSSEELANEVACRAHDLRTVAQETGNILIERPHLGGTLGSDSPLFGNLLEARSYLRAALASVEDGINAVQVWRKG